MKISNSKSDFEKNNKDKSLTKNAMLPFDTKNLNIRSIDNFYLSFHKLPNIVYEKNKTCKIKISEKSIDNNFSNLNIKNISEKYLLNIKKLNLNIKDFQYETDGRLVVGLGSESIYETSMCLHYIYGFPYIPGQAVKGILRNHIINEVFDGSEKNALKNITFCRIFGCDENGKIKTSVGSIVFFDAYPVNIPKLKLDVMNPHYSSYYGDKSNTIPPVDYDDTIPVNFMTVEDTIFRFIYGVKNNFIEIDGIKKYFDKPVNDLWDETQKEFLNKSLSEIVCEYLKQALEEKGVGAKTSVGYGYFNIDKEQEKKFKKEEKLKKILQEEQKFKEATKNMNELAIELYKTEEIEDENKKNDAVMKIYNNKKKSLKREEQKQVAEYVKKYLDGIHEWKVKINKNGEMKDKKSTKVKEICEILEIELPSKKS